MSDFTIKDSGKREQFEGGMQRDTTEGKSRPDLVRDGPMFLRWVNHLTKGAIKYIARNWMKAQGEEEYNRFLESTDRHYNIWFTWRAFGLNIEDPNNVTTEPLKEDHAAAVFFNINGVEYVADKLNEQEDIELERKLDESIQRLREANQKISQPSKVETTGTTRIPLI